MLQWLFLRIEDRREERLNQRREELALQQQPQQQQQRQQPEVAQQQPRIAAEHLYTIAKSIVSTLVWDEKGAVAEARAGGLQAYPCPSPYTPPETITDLLNALPLKNIPVIDEGTKSAIWDVFQELQAHIPSEALPLCQANYGTSAESPK